MFVGLSKYYTDWPEAEYRSLYVLSVFGTSLFKGN